MLQCSNMVVGRSWGKKNSWGSAVLNIDLHTNNNPLVIVYNF